MYIGINSRKAVMDQVVYAPPPSGIIRKPNDLYKHTAEITGRDFSI